MPILLHQFLLIKYARVEHTMLKFYSFFFREKSSGCEWLLKKRLKFWAALRKKSTKYNPQKSSIDLTFVPRKHKINDVSNQSIFIYFLRAHLHTYKKKECIKAAPKVLQNNIHEKTLYSSQSRFTEKVKRNNMINVSLWQPFPPWTICRSLSWAMNDKILFAISWDKPIKIKIVVVAL